MRKIFHRILTAVVLLCGVPAVATEIVERPDLGRHFEAEGVSGTFVMLDAQADRLYVFDRARAQRRFVPASTFKIFNSLVALETGAVKDENEIIPYGGKPQRLKEWEHDMDMRDAIRISNVPVYQELARRAGRERMNHYIKLVGYGNAEIGNVVDRFWLDGPLKISAIEQAYFTNRLAHRDLPFSERAMRIVRDIIQQEETPDHALFAKTGWDAGNGIGWWVGWVERSGKVYAFALNIDIRRDEDVTKRQSVARDCLKALQAL
jgi:beta-lactamase class D